MILFKEVGWKNFLSTGNIFNTVHLNKNSTTLIQGVSGAGKSTLIEAVCFSLFGKAFRDITKNSLINSINNKNCEVYITFETNGKNYKIVRGIKPTKFEIWVDDVLLDQNAASKDYQKVLENQILMFSYKTFTQTVVLGSTSFVPFMQLNTSSRREVIENILDIGVFGGMNVLLKQDIISLKDEISSLDMSHKEYFEKAKGLKRILLLLTDKNKERITDLETKIRLLEDEKVLLDKEVEALRIQRLPEPHDLLSLKKKKESGENYRKEIEFELKEIEKLQNFLSNNSLCSLCNQSIEHTHVNSQTGILNDRKNRLEEENLKNRISLGLLEKKIEESEKVNSHNSNIAEQITSKGQLNFRKLAEILELRNAIEELSKDNLNEEKQAKDELRDAVSKLMQIDKDKKVLLKKREIQEAAVLLLKDNGIKSTIIREYLPLINQTVNKYLKQLDMFVTFNLDDTFEETIKSRHRDVFTYESFSEGEKMRIDLALLFTWRYISKLKNSCNTNLLIMDEILTGRLDQSNTDLVIDLIKDLSKNTNTFIIAHADNLKDKFETLIEFEKRNNFSVII
jgi:DNA repair exonuclease SbcCD ATPase subunit